MENITKYIINYISQNRLVISKKVLLSVGIFIGVYVLSNFVIKRVQKRIEYNNIQSDDTYVKKLAHLIGRILYLVALVINVLIICEVIGIDVSLLMAGISLGIGFAIETMIGNIVSGFFIILNKKFKIGDSVELLGRFNTKGVIEEINLKHTIIRLIDQTRLLVPNSIMAATALKTFKTENIIRGDIDISVPRHVNIEQVKSIIRQTVNGNEDVLDKDYTSTYIKEFDDKGYKFNTIFFVDPHKATPLMTGVAIRKSLIEVFRQYGIPFTYEHMTVNFG